MSAAVAALDCFTATPFTSSSNVEFLESLLAMDSGAITGSQMLTAVLTHCYSYDEAKSVAEKLVLEFGGLAGVVNASRERLCSFANLSIQAWATLQVMRKFSGAVMRESFTDRPIIGNLDDVLNYLMVTIGQDLTESVRVLFLDSSNRLIKDELHSSGTRNFTVFYIRELLLRTSELRAFGVIIAHNHPSGAVNPSDQDKVTTYEIRDALSLIGATLIDSLIIGRNATFSFRSRGWLS